MKTLRLLSMLFCRPGEFFERTATIVDARLEWWVRRPPLYATEKDSEVIARLSSLFFVDLTHISREWALKEIEQEIRKGLSAMPPEAPFPLFHNADTSLARLCYLVVRLLRPRSVIETGVCYGVTSAYILKALEENSQGMLYSIDLPPLGKNADAFVGWLVPAHLRGRWRLIRGVSGKVLPTLLKELGRVDLFVHDSLHTYRNMKREFDIVTPCLSRPSAVIADDIEGNTAFLEWSERFKPDFVAVLKEEGKRSLMGLSVFLGDDVPVTKKS